MPTKSDPRVTVRLSPVDHAVLVAAADAAGVPLGSLIRDAAVREAGRLARDVSAGEVRMRRRRVVPVPPAAPGPVRVDTVSDAARWALDRQAKLNRAKGL